MVTATLNSGTETIRIDRSHLPVLLQLKTAGAVGVDDSTADALARLEDGGLVRDGKLHPMADAMLDIVTDPGLDATVERMRHGTVGAATIWATPYGATIGSRVEGALYELRLADAGLLPFHLFQLIHLRPLGEAAPLDCTLPAEVLHAAERHILESNPDAAGNVLTAAGIAAAPQLVGLLGARVASWRIHSVWSTHRGAVRAGAAGMDCGRRGHLLVNADTENRRLRLRSASFGEVVAAVRETLPR